MIRPNNRFFHARSKSYFCFYTLSLPFFLMSARRMIKGPFGRAYFSASALAHAKVVPNTSFSNGFTSEVFFQNELEGMSQKKWLTRLQLTSFLHNSPPTSPNYYFLVLPSIPSHVQLATYRRDIHIQGSFWKTTYKPFCQMIFQNGFGSSKEVVLPREPEPKPFFGEARALPKGPKNTSNK